MQGQGSTIDSFPEILNIEQGSVSNDIAMNQQSSLNNMLNSAEGRLLDHSASSSGSTCVGAISHNVQNFSGWNSGEPSSRLNRDNQDNDEGMKMEHGWSSSFSGRAGARARSEERLVDAPNIIFPNRLSIGHSGNQVRSGPLFLQGSSSNHIPHNVNLNARYEGNNNNGGPDAGVAEGPNLNNSGGLEADQASPANASSDNVGTSSGSPGYMVDENNGGSSSSLGGRGLSCKRKALEGSSGQSYPGGSSSCFSQAENSVWHTNPVRSDASSSLSLSTPSQNSPTIGTPDLLDPRFGIAMREVVDAFPPSSVPGNTESALRNFGRGVSPGHPQESVPFNLSSTRGGRLHQAPRPIPLSDPLDLRSTTAEAANSSALQSQAHAMHISGFSRSSHPFPWSGASNSRSRSPSSSLISRDRGALANLRSIPRSNVEHPMFVSTNEMRNMSQDPTNWSLATGNISNSGGPPPPPPRIGSSSTIHPLPMPSWIRQHNPSINNPQRLSEFAPWSLFPSVDSEPGGHSGNFSPLSSGPSNSSQDTVMSSGSHSQSHPQPFPRSALLMERQVDDALGMPRSLRALAADIEGRHRLISEIRQVLNAMRRGENLRVEDYMLFDPFIYHGMAEMHDRHRDMRLDVDNMSYEELLALEERIGDVCTGLSEETILKLMKQQQYILGTTESVADLEPCCICQEEYADRDDLGKLDCGHDFHTNCIKQWLMQKNLCPICKTTALHP